MGKGGGGGFDAADFEGAGVGGIKATNEVEEGGFAAAARASDCDEFALLDGEGNVLEGGDGLGAHAVGF